MNWKNLLTVRRFGEYLKMRLWRNAHWDAYLTHTKRATVSDARVAIRVMRLRKVGGGFIFVHRMLLEFFAAASLRQIRGT
jgi:hypothetical protein